MYLKPPVRLGAPIATDLAGFTLIELLVVVMIGGILAAIAIPSFLGRANAAKQAEAKTLLGALNRAQQAFYTEHNQFADDLNALMVHTINNRYYHYAIEASNQGPVYAIHRANPRIAQVRAYAGMAAIIQDQTGNLGLQTIVCESDTITQAPAPLPLHNGTSIDCAPGTSHLD